MLNKKDKNAARQKRHVRMRRNIVGTAERPRFNDETGETLVAASTVEKANKENYGGNIEAAKVVGAEIAKKALEKGIKTVVFDRGGYLYHGRVAALAEAAREAGLEF